MTDNYQTFTTHSIIKFENCYLGELNSINKTIDFHHHILATVNNYQ